MLVLPGGTVCALCVIVGDSMGNGGAIPSFRRCPREETHDHMERVADSVADGLCSDIESSM
jgi:hypothetical protein